jgi:hypothetical protein
LFEETGGDIDKVCEEFISIADDRVPAGDKSVIVVALNQRGRRGMSSLAKQHNTHQNPHPQAHR